MNVYKILVWIHQRLHTQIVFFFFQLNGLAQLVEKLNSCSVMKIHSSSFSG